MFKVYVIKTINEALLINVVLNIRVRWLFELKSKNTNINIDTLQICKPNKPKT